MRVINYGVCHEEIASRYRNLFEEPHATSERSLLERTLYLPKTNRDFADGRQDFGAEA